MGVTLTPSVSLETDYSLQSWLAHGMAGVPFGAVFDNSYATGGETPSPALTNFLRSFSVVLFEHTNGYTFEYVRSTGKIKIYSGAVTLPATAGIVDDSDSAATLGHPLYVVRQRASFATTVVAEGSATGLIKDSDTAAADGVQIYVVIDDEEFLPSYALGHLEFVSPTNAHGTCTVANGLGTLLIEDDDAAATNGVEVRAIAASGGLEATLTGSGRTVLVPLSDGQYIGIADSTTGSTPAVYFDEDASNTYDRLQAVVVDNADEPYKLIEITPAVSRVGPPSSRMLSLVTTGPGATTSQGTVGSASGGPEYDVAHDGAAALLAGAAVLYVQAAGAGFNATLPGEEDCWIPLANGEFIKVTHAASPSGVQVYWDHDAANSWERMKAVVVDNADETYSVDTAISMRQNPAVALAELTSATDLSALTVRGVAFGPRQ